MLAINEQEFELLSKYIKTNYGIKLGKEKVNLVIGRLSYMIEKMGLNSFSDYYNYIITDNGGEATRELLNRITTNHTYFMRETEHFKLFRDKVLPKLKIGVKDKDLRIWSAGCSTGEEPYTLAMIIDEYFSMEKMFWNTDILATDISSKVLNKAEEGIYTAEEIKSLPDNWKINYFKFSGNNYVISDRIKKSLVLRKFNLMQDIFPFKRKFHTIFCRNVMIYFDEATKMKLIEKFYGCMEKGGYLFIGHSETLGRENCMFKYVQPAVYRKE